MDRNRIKALLQQAADTQDLLIGVRCLNRAGELFKNNFKEAVAVVVADDNTYAAAGKSVHENLKSAGIRTLEPFVFPGFPILKAHYNHVEELRAYLQGCAAVPVAVGSGTINDLVKLSAYECGRRYMSVATAASVDGYSSYGAPITRKGFKITLDCPAPLVILADTDILRHAPQEMTASGYADLAGKITAGADWIIADLAGVEPIEQPAWDTVQTNLGAWIASPRDLASGRPRALEDLFEGLIMSGFAMQILRSSRPASGSEHLFSNFWEMQQEDIPVSHGFKVAIGTLAATAMLETVLAGDIRQLDMGAVCKKRPDWEERKEQIGRVFAGSPILEQVLSESRAKYISGDRLLARLGLIKSCWSELQVKVKRQLIPYADLKQMLIQAGCPVTPEQIGLSRERVRETVVFAQMIRNRYTVLDLAFELGRLKDCTDEIFASREYLC